MRDCVTGVTEDGKARKAGREGVCKDAFKTRITDELSAEYGQFYYILLFKFLRNDNPRIAVVNS